SLTAPTPTELYTLSLHDALPISEPRCSAWFPKHRRGTVSNRHMKYHCRPPKCRGRETRMIRWSRLPSWIRNQPSSLPLMSALIRSEEHTSELQSLAYLVCRLLLE